MMDGSIRCGSLGRAGCEASAAGDGGRVDFSWQNGIIGTMPVKDSHEWQSRHAVT
jgi:hypothetical protein